LKQKDKNKIKKLLIDSMAFLKVEAYTGISDAIEKIGDIIDEDSYDTKHDKNEEDDEPIYDYADDYDDEDEDDHDSSF
jgi:hypothetical protein